MLNIVAQIGIVVTGGLVRLTGSGLGCPTWPECVPGSYTPVVEQAEGFHKYIEFGNRTLTFMVLATSIAVLLIAVSAVRHGRPRSLLIAGGIPVVLVVAQALIGGVTVLTGLHPATVAIHFLVSMLLVAASVHAYVRLQQPDVPRVTTAPAPVRWLGFSVAAVGAVVLVLGTVVTGSGPHSGDADTPARLGFDPRMMSWLHADTVMMFVGLVIGLLVAAHVVGSAASLLRRATWWLLVVTSAQGFIGYVQYFTGLPEALVLAHMLGAALLAVAITATLETMWVPATRAHHGVRETAETVRA